MSARLTVAIVTYRPDRALLARTVESLAGAANQARADGLLSGVRLFLVDNGPPESAALVRDVADGWPAVLGSAEVISGHGNVGYGRANNAVLGRLDSDFHLVMNPDVELDETTLSAALVALRDHADIALATPAAFDKEGTRQYLCKRYPSVGVLLLRGFAPAFLRRPFTGALDAYEMRDAVGDKFLKGVTLASGCFMLMRTDLFKRIGGFDPRFFMYFEDYDLSLRLGREASVAYVPGARIVHHGGEASRKGLRHVAWFVASAWKFFSIHGWRR